ncbi:crotonase/enoyl-CoA hydratase family protein [Pigmentiphaga soli]|uniref:Crotonase/enoyl-CoA hydratase family protein n=1 Tax=Pigmentiphaga soli TaxID=1007095 RepID=A0ABP8GX01_9BURK
MKDLEYDVADHIATLTLNRPEKKNAFTEDMLSEMCERLQQAQADDNVRVIVLTGAGDAFCSGGDVSRRANELEKGPPTVLQNKQRLMTKGPQRVALALTNVDKPVLAALNGVAVGAGMDLALMCDLRVATRSARLCEGYIRVGLVPGNGACYFLPRMVGVGKALELLWTADFISSEEALRLGLVEQVYDDDSFREQTAALARKIASAPPVQVRAIKRTLYQSLGTDLRTSLELVSSHMAIVNTTDDYREAIAAFKEKRQAHFQGK